jgi:hypothetical protein
MRRWLAIAAFSSAVLLATPLLAQMRGGSRGGATMGRGGFSSGGSIGIRSGPTFGGGQRFGANFGTGLRQPSFNSGRSFGGFRGTHFGPGRFRRPVFFSSVFPYYSGYYGYPAYYSGYAYSTADYPAYDYYGQSYYSAQAYAAQNDIARQQQDIDQLEAEVARLREQKEPDREAREVAPPQPESRAEVSSPTVLVFRDKHTQEVQNYAIVGGTLWVFSEQRATKLPLSWLDIEATSKANDDRGIDFQLPK